MKRSTVGLVAGLTLALVAFAVCGAAWAQTGKVKRGTAKTSVGATHVTHVAASKTGRVRRAAATKASRTKAKTVARHPKTKSLVRRTAVKRHATAKRKVNSEWHAGFSAGWLAGYRACARYESGGHHVSATRHVAARHHATAKKSTKTAAVHKTRTASKTGKRWTRTAMVSKGKK